MFRDREPKYPGLAAAIRASGSGVAYMTAYQRLLRGYSWEKAINTPTHVKRVRPPKKRREIISVHELKSLFAWERPEWNTKARAERALAFAPVVRNPLASKRGRKIRKRYIPKANDTSPDHIRILRVRLCDGFIKTGDLDVNIFTALRDYANSVRKDQTDANPKTIRDTDGVSPEPHSPRYRQGRNAARNDGVRVDDQTLEAPKA